MQDGRSVLPRHSSGSLAAEASQPPHELPTTLRTNPLLYPGPVSPERRKLAAQLVGGMPHCPEHQPLAPFTPPGAAIQAPWLPFSVVPLPPKLIFETWWHEGPQRRVAMHVTYDVATKRCLAGTYVSLDMEVTTLAGAPIDEYDMHVGAEVRVAGRRVTLRKPLTLATQSWLDQQARAMLIAKYRLEQELNKFRPVVPVPAQYTDPKRAETLDFGSHQHMPAGGRLSLRALYDTLLQLAEQLRQHRGRLPPLPDAVSERVTAAAAASSGPPDWSPERREMERREAEARQREALESAGLPDDSEWRNDLTHWLDSIPLAASCCTRYTLAHKPSHSESAKSGKGDREHHRSGGHRGGRPSAAGLLASAVPTAGASGSSAGGNGAGSTLAFNLSVVTKLAAMASGSGATGSGTFGSSSMGSGVGGGGAAASGGGGGGGGPSGRAQSPAAVAASMGSTTPRPPAAASAWQR
ncbi:hypothetical protein Vretimale_3516 [Volvox reticuliferus]|uniref:Uncharacterized protein n=1 Tax=Volvox reticuliferus TaxID=1737510 RepID=A0A8J4BX27_9CHLO|nr:hypothetical protein Vretifemale_1075 [Volvox reticuliferus]GIL97960.1 hypothetical protein Vretimale_3516 [Volvox reticuliferus]